MTGISTIQHDQQSEFGYAPASLPDGGREPNKLFSENQ